MDDIEHGSTDYRVNKNDKHANYSLYRNLENEEYVKNLNFWTSYFWGRAYYNYR